MPICLTSKKAQKRIRQHEAAAAKVFKNRDPLLGRTLAVTEEQKQATIERGWAWGNEHGSIRIVPPENAQASAVVLEGGWGVGGVVMPVVEPTGWSDGVFNDNEPAPKWVDPTPPKTEEELTKERVDKALIGWPWISIPSKLIAVVRVYYSSSLA